MSSDDRDDTPRGHRRPISQPQSGSGHWDDEQRATVGATRRRIVTAPRGTTAVRGTTIGGVPVVIAHHGDQVDDVEHAEVDRTPVFHLLDTPLTEAGASELIAYMKRIVRKLEDASSDERRNMDELRKLMATPPPAAIAALEAQIAELRARPAPAAIATLQAQLDELRARPTFAVVDRLDRIDRELAELREVIEGEGQNPGLAAQVEAHDRVVTPTRKLANWAAAGAVVAVISVVGFVYARGASEQHVTDEIQTLRHQSEQLERQIDRLQSQLQNQKDSRP